MGYSKCNRSLSGHTQITAIWSSVAHSHSVVSLFRPLAMYGAVISLLCHRIDGELEPCILEQRLCPITSIRGEKLISTLSRPVCLWS